MKGKIIIKGKISPALIQIGYKSVSVFDNKLSRSIWDVEGTVIFNGKTKLGQGSKVSVCKEGILEIGNNFTITAESSIICHKHIIIGHNTLFSWDILIMDTDFHPIFDENNIYINPDKKVEIGNNVWIGCRCLILKGVKIPNSSIIAANSTLTKSFDQESALYGGTPVRALKENVHWKER